MSSANKVTLLVNLGTPTAPTTSAVKRYLAEFLSDKRVVNLPKWLWYPLLYGVILPLRGKRSAQLYQAIWQPTGSPLLYHSQCQQQALQRALPEQQVMLAMTYGQPALTDCLAQLIAAKPAQVVILPLYPQYSSSTTAAIWDKLVKPLTQSAYLPSIHFIRDYAEHPLYIKALVNSIRQQFARCGQPDKLLFSFHGIPQRYVALGDDYPERCQATVRAVCQQLQLPSEQVELCYQSRFGKAAWLTPYTLDTVVRLAQQGHQHIQVICPGFAVDCLETLEEIDQQNRQAFLQAGGTQFHYIPALNATAEHIALLADLATSC